MRSWVLKNWDDFQKASEYNRYIACCEADKYKDCWHLIFQPKFQSFGKIIVKWSWTNIRKHQFKDFFQNRSCTKKSPGCRNRLNRHCTEWSLLKPDWLVKTMKNKTFNCNLYQWSDSKNKRRLAQDTYTYLAIYNLRYFTSIKSSLY